MRLNLRYKIIFLLAIIFCGVICQIFAQNVSEFKTRSNNVKDRNIKQNLSSDWKGDTSYSENTVSRYSRFERYSTPSKIRFRFLSGSYSSDQKNVTTSTSKIIWDQLGLGQSVFKSEGNRSGNIYDIENNFIDLSYTFGDEYTFTLGGRSITSGEINITSSESIKFNSTNVYGSGYFGILGVEFGIFEILWGYEYFRYAFIDFDTESSSDYWGNFEDFGGQYTLGLGLVF